MNSVLTLRNSIVHKTFNISRKNVVSRKPLKVKCNSNTSDVPQIVEPSEFNYLKFAETVNGRCAMQGFIWGSVKEAMTHETIMQQLLTQTANGHIAINSTCVLEFVGIVALVTLGTVFTSVVKDASAYSSETFTNDAEMINARTAMIGFVILSVIHMT